MENDTSTLNAYLGKLDEGDRVYIDIGASYETHLDPSFIHNGKKTIFIEADKEKISRGGWIPSSNFAILNEKATPHNIIELLDAHLGDKDITYLDIDIDGYDYFVLEALLDHRKPYLFIAEINEKIPPPVKFTVKYSPDYWWDGSHFYGMSVSQAYELVSKYGYDVVQLTGNNLICIRKDKNTTGVSLSIETAFNEGYRIPRLEGRLPMFGYNSNVDFLLNLNPPETLEAVNAFFKPYKGRFEAALT